MAIAFGSVAFVVSQFWGRAAGVGIAGGLLVAGWIIQGYHAVVPGFGVLTLPTPWSWTYDHAARRPIRLDLAAARPGAHRPGATGIWIFARRTSARRRPRRSTCQRPQHRPRSWRPDQPLPRRAPASALAWGIGLGGFMLVMASISNSISEALADSPTSSRSSSRSSRLRAKCRWIPAAHAPDPVHRPASPVRRWFPAGPRTRRWKAGRWCSRRAARARWAVRALDSACSAAWP